VGAGARHVASAAAARLPAWVAIAAMVAACATGPTAPVATGADDADLAFVDAHVHLNDVAMELALMEANGIAQAVVFWGRNGDNAAMLAAARAHPGRFIPFASISPERARYGAQWARDDPQLLAALDELLRGGGFRGIGEISVAHFPGAGFPETDFSPRSPTMDGIMALARRYSVPVLIHCEITRLAEFEALLSAYRDVAVVWAHGGYTPYFLARRMLERHPNLHYELSARTWRVHPRSPDYTILATDTVVWPEWLRLIEANPSRFIVGTDSSNHSTAADQAKIDSVKALLRQLTPSARRSVARDNILRLVAARQP
jgi:predicted TIM-barrel fold metal-dependent hydrolase